MLICKICDFVGHTISKHIWSEHKLRSEEYYIKYVLQVTNPPTCANPICTNLLKFIGISSGYHKTCSHKCASICEDPEIIKSREEKRVAGTKKKWSTDTEYRTRMTSLISNMNTDPTSNTGFKNHWTNDIILTDKERQRRSDLAKDMNDNNAKFGYCKLSDELKSKCVANLKKKHKEDVVFQSKMIDNISNWAIHESPKAGSLHVRSTYEKRACELFDANPHVVMYKHESIRIPYIGLDGEDHTYVTDFELLWDTGLVEIIEIKPSYQVNYALNISKFHAAKLYAEENNAIFTIMTEEELQLVIA